MVRIIIAGGIDLNDFYHLESKCNKVFYELLKEGVLSGHVKEDVEHMEIVSGTAKGADKLGLEYIWYKLLCYYNAKTELFDRSLTDMRSKYDPTEAYICGEVRHLSNHYALKVRKFIMDAAIKFNIPKDIMNFNRFNYFHYSAQGWINEYYRLEENGEMEFLKYE